MSDNTTDEVIKRLEQLQRERPYEGELNSRPSWLEAVAGTGKYPSVDKEQPLIDSIATARAAQITQVTLDYFLNRKGFEHWWSDCGAIDREMMIKEITREIRKQLA